jgi:hypothetical protein
MNRTLIIISLLFCFSCSQQKNEEKAVAQAQKVNKPIEEAIAKTVNSKVRLSEKLYGDWINTSLFDSTLAKHRLYPWVKEFYGDLHLTINKGDSLNIRGNMDGGDVRINVKDEYHFSTKGRVDNPTFEYLPDRDLLHIKTKNNSMLFRRIGKADAKQIIGDEHRFNQFFINKYFTADYFIGADRPKFTTIWCGFETFTPFNFDAVGINNGKGDIEYFGWEFSGDTLTLYSTTYDVDDESGFRIYSKGSLARTYVKRK